ncbi:hypothetical protein A2U01_0093360, partial [Trifolium medium]|nr:hypothetical protein [Trifolium medium]
MMIKDIPSNGGGCLIRWWLFKEDALAKDVLIS